MSHITVARLDRARARATSLAPGVAVSAIVALAAAFISEHHGGPTLVYALLLGMALHFLSTNETTAPGIHFSSRTVLRVGVAMLGVRIGVAQIMDLGAWPLAIVVVAVLATVVFGRLVAPILKLTPEQGILTGGAVAICGASAALAIASVLPKSKDAETNTIFTVVAVTVLSTIAMIVYPIAIRMAQLDGSAAGVILGGAIHDVAQVVGAGYSISDEVGIEATYIKLCRVAMLVPIVALLYFMYANASSKSVASQPLFPAFLVAFVVFATANSFGVVPTRGVDLMSTTSRWFLVCAISALGMKTSLQQLAQIGWRPLGLVIGETVFILLVVLVGLLLSRM